MTRTALRRGPVAPPPRAGLHRLDDGELLDLVRSEPIGSALRSDACEVRLLGQDPAAAPSPPPGGSPFTQTRRQA
ncbi:MAG: hypothetical protein ACHP9Z_05650 [Streptosporangiales bacterium]